MTGTLEPDEVPGLSGAVAAEPGPRASAEIGAAADDSPEKSPQDDGSPQNAEPTPDITKPPFDPSDLAPTTDAAPLPGAHRGGFSRALTGPVSVMFESAPIEAGTEDGIDYTPAEWVEPPPRVRFAPMALTFAIAGLLVSLLVGWGFLLGLIAIGAGAVALRRRESRGMAIWAISLAGLSILYSAGWLLFAASQGAFV